MIYFISGISFYVHHTDGAIAISSDKLLPITKNINSSPYRKKCHASVNNYTEPSNACTYFSDDIRWAVIGDSHIVELAYALADELDKVGQGIKHLSFSGCIPSFKQNKEVSNCTKWTNDAVASILKDVKIENIVIGYRYSAALFGDQLSSYPSVPKINPKDDLKRKETLDSLDQLIKIMSKNKTNIFVIKPIPELGSPINTLLKVSYNREEDVKNIKGTSKEYYLKRNQFILNYFNNTEYLNNVKFIDPAGHNCDENYCWAVRQGIPLYFDDDHLSILGALPIAKEIISFL
jgi:hypothetical protein